MRSGIVIAAVAARELLSLLVTPLGYLVAALFLLLQGWNFALLLRVLNDPLAAPGPVMQYWFGGSFFVFWLPVIFTCAALAVRGLAEERAQGTLEALLTTPVRPGEVVVGKYLASLAYWALLWAPTGAYVIALASAGVDADPGPVASGYLGVLLVGAAFLAVAVLAQALTTGPVAAAVATAVACSIAVVSGLLAPEVDADRLRALLEATSLLAMTHELSQGIVDLRWIGLCTAVVVGALAVAAAALDPHRDRQRWLQAGLWLVIAVHGAVLAGRHGGRHDVTSGGVYSLGDRAIAILAELPEVEVVVVVPQALGGGHDNPVALELREVLRRMAEVAPALRVRTLDPDRDHQRAALLIREHGLEGRELADGVVLIRAGTGTRLRRAHVLPHELVELATDESARASGPRVKAFRGEEALLRRFLAVGRPERTRVCASQGHGEPRYDGLEPFDGYAHLADLIEGEDLELRTVVLDDAAELEACDALVLAGIRGTLPRDAVDRVTRLAERGVPLLVLGGAVVLRGRARLAEHGLEPMLAERGIRFGSRVVLDPHEMSGAAPLLAFTLSEGWSEHEAARSLIGRPVSFQLVRELEVDGEAGAHAVLETGDDAWAEADVTILAGGPRPEPGPEATHGPFALVAVSERGGSRLAVVASDQFVLNAHLRPDVAYDHGRDLVLNLLGWLLERGELLGIRPRPREHVKLVLRPEQLADLVWWSVLGPPLFVGLVGATVLRTRRRRRS